MTSSLYKQSFLPLTYAIAQRPRCRLIPIRTDGPHPEIAVSQALDAKASPLHAAALEEPWGQQIYQRISELGLPITKLKNNRVTGLRGDTERETYANAKQTMGGGQCAKRCLQASAHSAFRRLAVSPCRRLSGALSILLFGQQSFGAAGHSRLCQPARYSREHRELQRAKKQSIYPPIPTGPPALK